MINMINEETKDNTINEKTIKQLSNSFINLYEPSLFTVKNELNDLINKQNILLQEVTGLNKNLNDGNIQVIQEMISSIKPYKDKLLTIRKNMTNIHQKTKNLKKRALEIQEFKSKELANKIQKRQNEESLIAKPGTTTTSATTLTQ